MFQIKGLIQRLLEVNDGLLEIAGSETDNTTNNFVRGANCSIDAFEQSHWVSLKEVEDLPSYLKQKTEVIKRRS
ncbi:hypothetical protein DPMN_119223 [Dreissena polymorpha]|uniref:Uncharacterized protein n=1 Tax=Dreissena polymorpha TaxID=45954 RepID=A0A9D4JR20_DREPO|nr:hypothetical protein DPMN_119223 [Dreissena polymorpha]